MLNNILNNIILGHKKSGSVTFQKDHQRVFFCKYCVYLYNKLFSENLLGKTIPG